MSDRITVTRTTLELSDKTYDVLSNLVTESYKNACILWIDEIDNPVLYSEFIKKKEELSELRKSVPNTKLLFHGTSIDLIDKICLEGFDPTYNRNSAFGLGTYFASNASYSYNYCCGTKDEISYMFIAEVLIGNSIVISGSQSIDTTKYDTSVNNLKEPSIFVSPYKYGTYPKYVMAFYKNAK